MIKHSHLARAILPGVPFIGKDLTKLVKWLRGFQILISVVAIIVGIRGLLF